jgi:integrase
MVWWVEWYDAAGKRHREKAGSKSDAQDLYMKRKADARAGKKLGGPLNRKIVSVGSLIDRYEPEILTRNAKSRSEYARLGRLWREEMGDCSAEDVTAGDIETWKAKRLQTHAPATVNLGLRYLKMLYNLAIRDQVLALNPLARGRVREARENNQRDRILLETEEAKLPGVLPRWLWLATQVALHTGLRSGELFGAKARAVDLKRKHFVIQDAKGGGRQTVRLNPVALEALRELLGLHSSEWLFPNKFGSGPRDATSVTKIFKRRCQQVGIEGVLWHSLRHTYISRLCMLGVPLPTVQKLARHKSITMTLRYAHLCPDHLEESLDLLARKFGVPATEPPLDPPPPPEVDSGRQSG